jgi:hypothetical protein
MSRLALLVLALVLACPTWSAAEPASTAPPSVPGDDIFGFTSTTDTGDPGARSVSFETTSRAGRAFDRFWATTLKTEFSLTPIPNLALSISPFVSYYRVRQTPDAPTLSRADFDGLSGEVMWRFLTRTSFGTAAAVSFEPRYARMDGATGVQVEAYAWEFKLFVDQVIVPDRLYAALNLNFAPSRQRLNDASMPDAPWVSSSGTNVSAALAWQLTQGDARDWQVFLGLEARWLAAFDGLWLDRMIGSALFVGPNMLVRFPTDDPSRYATFNVAWTPQVAGRATDLGGSLDLTNFERHQLRAKLAFNF